ncbi:MAG: aldehyde dehydrogenase family protein [Planctomycetes bacterium]|nr:aldehyde dehydrogenase family protein [Planctomycetota bacterium]
MSNSPDQPNESVERHVADARNPGSRKDTDENPALAETRPGDPPASPAETVVSHVAAAGDSGSTQDTQVMRRESSSVARVLADGRTPGSEVVTREIPAARGAADPYDDLETREVPVLKDEWRDRAQQAAEAMGASAEVVGEWESDHGDSKLAASVVAASGEVPLPDDRPPDTAAFRPVMAAARRAQAAWGALRLEQRKPHFDALLQELVDKRNDYAPALGGATGRPMVESLWAEYLPVLEVLRGLEHVVSPLLVDRFGAPQPEVMADVASCVRLVPWGVVLIATGPGLPFALPMTLVINALATGNAVVLVPHEGSPKVNDILRKLLARCGLPENLVQVRGGGWQAYRALLNSRPDLAVFDGDWEQAHAVARQCAEQGIACRLPRPAKDMLVILPNADPETAVRSAVWGAFGTGGLAPGATERIVVEASIYDKFRVRFIEALRDTNSHHAQLANLQSLLDTARFQRLVTDAVGRGARVTWPAGEDAGRWIHWKGGVLEGVPESALAARQPMRGPACLLYRAEQPVATARELLAVCPANSISVLGAPDRKLRAELEQLATARLSIGEVLPGGVAWHGGDFSGPSLDSHCCGPRAMLRAQVVHESEQGQARVGWFPYTDDKSQALMDYIVAEYDTHAVTRFKARWRLRLSGHNWRLLHGED